MSNPTRTSNHSVPVSSDVKRRYVYYFNSHRAEQFDLFTPACIFKLHAPLTLSAPGNVFEVSMPRAMIPSTFYQFSALRGSTTLQFTVGLAASSITILDGNYTILQLATLVSSTLTAQLIALGYASAIVSAAYNSATNRLRLDLYNPSVLSISVLPSKLSVALGFSGAWTLSDTSSAFSDIDTNIAPINMLFITSDALSSDDSYEQLRNVNTTTSIISSIPLIHSAKYYIPFEPASPIRTRITSDTLSFIDFNIIDNFGEQIFNFPVAWTFVLIVEEIQLLNHFDPPASSFKEQLPIQPNEVGALEKQSLRKLDEISSLLSESLTSTESQLKKRKNV